jgi:C4-dicarboxylate-specific signal transduction histidine kinase
MSTQETTMTVEQSNATLHMSAADMETIMSAIQAGIVIMDAETHEIIEINNAALELIGRPRQEVVGQCCHSFICPAEKGKCPITDLHTKVDNSERVLLNGAGNRVPILKTVTAVTLRGRACLLECFLDLTGRKRVEEELRKTQGKLTEASRLAGMAEVASDVLHNVGNVLNSVNTSTSLVSDHLKQSRIANISRVAALLREHAADLGEFLSRDPRGRQLPEYLSQLGEHLANEQAALLKEMEQIRRHVEHIKEIVAMQQSYARVSGVSDMLNMTALVEDALRINASALARHEVRIVRDYEPDLPQLVGEKHKVLQILVNLISNAKYACDESSRPDKQVTVRITNGEDRVRVAVIDNGVGIAPENMQHMFKHGFTTRKHGHGFGLHSGAVAAREMGGTLAVHSDGVGHGAVFTLELPLQPPPKPPGS